MERRRVLDGLVGAAVAVGVLLLLVVVLLVVVSEPRSTTATPDRPRVEADVEASTEPPTDLGAAETWLGDLRLDAGTLATPDALLTDVTAVGQGVRSGPDGLTAESLAVDATVPFAVVADQLGGGSTVAGVSAREASVTRSVELLGRQLRVVATGTVEVVDGRLVVEPTSVDVGGPGFLSDALGAAARRLVTIEQDVEGVPAGLVLQDVTVVDDGFRAHLEGVDVRLDP